MSFIGSHVQFDIGRKKFDIQVHISDANSADVKNPSGLLLLSI